METNLKYLETCLRNIDSDGKEFYCCCVLKNKDEFIMKKVWRDDINWHQIRCPLYQDFSSLENIQRLEDKLESSHIQSLPKYVHLRGSSAIENQYGVWSNLEIPKGIRFGPYGGVIVNDEDEVDQSGYSWKILEDEDIGYFVDARNQNESNWLRYVNFAHSPEQQNLIALHHNGKIYYKAIRDIAPDRELLVWYRNECAPLVGTVREDTGEIRDVCRKRFLQKSQLEKHKPIHIRERVYTCDICEKGFSRKDVLKQHKHLHTGEKPYTCEICEKTFRWKRSLEQHKNIHTREKPYACKTCDKAFVWKSQLERHNYIHMGEKPYLCEICEKTFTRKSSFEQHKYIHTGEKPYLCETCGKAFVQKSHLEQHKHIHTRERIYVCDICEKSFSRKDVLKQHNHLHSGEKPYTCEACEKTFWWKSSLEKHKIVHTRENIFSCNV